MWLNIGSMAIHSGISEDGEEHVQNSPRREGGETLIENVPTLH